MSVRLLGSDRLLIQEPQTLGDVVVLESKKSKTCQSMSLRIKIAIQDRANAAQAFPQIEECLSPPHAIFSLGKFVGWSN
ncbi:MAG: hypothetical protein AB1589_18320 [Cyanobacteriota bacterium]